MDDGVGAAGDDHHSAAASGGPRVQWVVGMLPWLLVIAWAGCCCLRSCCRWWWLPFLCVCSALMACELQQAWVRREAALLVLDTGLALSLCAVFKHASVVTRSAHRVFAPLVIDILLFPAAFGLLAAHSVRTSLELDDATATVSVHVGEVFESWALWSVLSIFERCADTRATLWMHVGLWQFFVFNTLGNLAQLYLLHFAPCQWCWQLGTSCNDVSIPYIGIALFASGFWAMGTIASFEWRVHSALQQKRVEPFYKFLGVKGLVTVLWLQPYVCTVLVVWSSPQRWGYITRCLTANTERIPAGAADLPGVSAAGLATFWKCALPTELPPVPLWNAACLAVWSVLLTAFHILLAYPVTDFSPQHLGSTPGAMAKTPEGLKPRVSQYQRIGDDGDSMPLLPHAAGSDAAPAAERCGCARRLCASAAGFGRDSFDVDATCRGVFTALVVLCLLVNAVLFAWDAGAARPKQVCGALNVPFGRVHGGRRFFHSCDRAVITCDSGFSGPSSAVCGSDGHFHAIGGPGPQLECSPTPCAATEVMNSDHAAAQSIRGHTGDVRVVTCSRGYSGGGRLECRPDGTFAAMDGPWDRVRCWPRPCDPAHVLNSDRSAPGSVTGGTADEVLVRCLDGYSGGGVMRCTANGTWSPVSCVPMRCGDLVVPFSAFDGARVVTGSTGDAVTVACRPGYVGGGVARCSVPAEGPRTASGRLAFRSKAASPSFSAVTCSPAACAPTEVPNSDKAAAGSIDGRTGDAVTVTCDLGYQGGGEMRCSPDGAFKPPVRCARARSASGCYCRVNWEHCTFGFFGCGRYHGCPSRLGWCYTDLPCAAGSSDACVARV